MTDKHLTAVENGIAKTDQCEDNRKLGNSFQNQQKKYNLRSRKANDIAGKSKLNDVNFKSIEIYKSTTIDIQGDEDYTEMIQSDFNWISGYSTNMFSSSGGQSSRFHQSQHQMHQMPHTRGQYNQLLLGQTWYTHRHTWGWLQYFFPTLIHLTGIPVLMKNAA